MKQFLQVVVSVNVEGHGKARFRLVYEDLLQRHVSRYQHIVHVNLDQPVRDFSIRVSINESLPILQLRVPELKTDPNAIDSNLKDNEMAKIENNVEGDPRKANILFQPDVTTQKQWIEANKGETLQGQLIVEYDVDRKDHDSEVQLMDGYFVHFFAPDSLPTLPKHVVFVIDISGSMSGEKLKQTKDAMVTILDDLNDNDHFNILYFSDEVDHWSPETEGSNSLLTFKGTKELKEAALKFVLSLEVAGGTNIHDAMLEALKRVNQVKASEVSIPSNAKPLIIFLTDGEPTTGVTSRPEIKQKISAENEETQVPIYGLAFGNDADFDLIKFFSLSSSGFARKIFEGADAAIQLEDFYKDLSSPLLKNIKFSYVGETITEVTNSNDKRTFFKGNEFVVAGKLSKPDDTDASFVVDGESGEGNFQRRLLICPDAQKNQPLTFPPLPFDCILPWPVRPIKPEEPAKPTNFIERLWAFLTIKNLLAEKASETEKAAEKEISLESEETTKNPVDGKNKEKLTASESKALKLALKYNFVTKLTSLVVTRPTVSDSKTEPLPEIEIDPVPVVAFNQQRPFGTVGFSANNRFHTFQNYPAPSFALASANYGDSDFSIGGSYAPESVVSEDASAPSPPAPSGPHTTTITPATTTLLTPAPGPCNITLFTQTYLRGESFSTLDDVTDLSVAGIDFGKKVTSFQISNSCCWTLYTSKDFEGESKAYRSGIYNSATDLGNFFRNVSSLKKC